MLITVTDTETTGPDATKDDAIEVAAVLYDTTQRAILSCFSTLLPARENPAEAINHIPAALLLSPAMASPDLTPLVTMAMLSSAIVAHNANFDEPIWHRLMESHAAPILAQLGIQRIPTPWVCSLDHLTFPSYGATGPASRKLTHLAADHGFINPFPHRALPDTLVLVQLLSTIPNLDEQIANAMLPRTVYQAFPPFERKDDVKHLGFRWHPESKSWRKALTEPELAAMKVQIPWSLTAVS